MNRRDSLLLRFVLVYRAWRGAGIGVVRSLRYALGILSA